MNKYLHEKKVVFVLLNEVGNVNDKTIKLHENYDKIPNGELTTIIYNRKYKVYKILQNMTYEHTLICKVSTEEKDINIILISVYSPPDSLNELRNNNIVSILNTINLKYLNFNTLSKFVSYLSNNKFIIYLFFINII